MLASWGRTAGMEKAEDSLEPFLPPALTAKMSQPSALSVGGKLLLLQAQLPDGVGSVTM